MNKNIDERVIILIFLDDAIMKSFPRKLFVEPTTRCNFNCAMCVKQASDHGIEEGDLTMERYQSLIPVFGHLEKLILTGIGEPLLHPGLEHFIALAREHLLVDSQIGLQTNGAHLTSARAMSLAQAGLDEVCISIDSISSDMFQQIRNSGQVEDILGAMEAVNSTRSKAGKQLHLGIEFVLMKQNLAELPQVIKWAADRGASFAVVTHVLAYEKGIEAQRVYSPNLSESRELFQKYIKKAEVEGLDFVDYLSRRWKYHCKYLRTPTDQALVDLGNEMITESSASGIPLHLRNLSSEDTETLETAKDVFETTRKIANEKGLSLRLPELLPQLDRHCQFIEEDASFVTWKGTVHPCYFLWHPYACYQNKQKQQVSALSFGELDQQELSDIWESEAYVNFREKVLQYKYPHCTNCNLNMCNMVSSKGFDYDCYTIDVPCGSCPWPLGLLNCLQ